MTNQITIQVTTNPFNGQLVTVEERAIALGYPTHLVSEQRSLLGRWVVQAGVLVAEKVQRYCWGKLVKVNGYKVSTELDEAIKSFFCHK